MTIEASLVIPMVFFVWIACISLTALVRVHTQFQNEFTNVALQMAMNRESIGTLEDLKLLWNKNSMETGGIRKITGYDFSKCRFEEDWIYFDIRYKVHLLSGIIPIPPITLKNKVTIRKWTGEDPEKNQEFLDGNISSNYVYVTEYGKVYHEDRMCSHIRLQIHQADASKAMNYLPCEKCIQKNENQSSIFYVTEYGACYHNTLGCSGLKRYVKKIDRQTLNSKEFQKCTRCGGG